MPRGIPNDPTKARKRGWARGNPKDGTDKLATALKQGEWLVMYVRHPNGPFIGITKDEASVRAHWGAQCTTRELRDETDVQEATLEIQNATHRPARILIAV